MALPKRKRRTQPESPRWLPPAHGHGGIDLFQVIQYLSATVEHDPPFISQTQTPGGTVKETNTHTRFEPDNTLANGRTCEP
ncbi:hypothetical protein D3C80_967940 [compost metagenome]